MKNTIIRILILLFVVSTFAQQGINYKAVIKDGSGNLVTSQAITVQFRILQGAGMIDIYQENHTPTTDSNGIVFINIGEGIPLIGSGVFADIDWGSDIYFLNTQINSGGGLQDMGTTGFKTVPYAFHAKTAESVSGISGTTNFVPKSVDGVALGDSQLFDDGTNIGIGTTIPISKIDLRATGLGFSQQVDAVSPSIGFYTDFTGAYLQTNNDFSLRFATNNGLTQMILSQNGNLGIGNNSPKALLSLSNVAANKKITLYDAADNDHEFLGFGIAGGILRYQVEQGNSHVFYAATSSTTSDELLRIQADGKVGIGNNAPIAKLDVTGDIKIVDGTQGVGKILTSDSDGLASWDDSVLNQIAALEARIAALEPQPASIGDIRAGGVVFWVDSTGLHGLVCAFSDYPSTRQWGCSGTDLPNVPNVFSFPLAGPGAEIGDGITNTDGILADCPTAPAALAARSLGPEWFLPSAKELDEMYVNKTTLEAVAGFSAFGNIYWSSTEDNANNAWYRNFGNGTVSNPDKINGNNVRAVRAF